RASPATFRSSPLPRALSAALRRRRRSQLGSRLPWRVLAPPTRALEAFDPALATPHSHTKNRIPQVGRLRLASVAFRPWCDIPSAPTVATPYLWKVSARADISSARARNSIADRKSTRLNSSHQIISYAL